MLLHCLTCHGDITWLLAWIVCNMFILLRAVCHCVTQGTAMLLTKLRLPDHLVEIKMANKVLFSIFFVCICLTFLLTIACIFAFKYNTPRRSCFSTPLCGRWRRREFDSPWWQDARVILTGTTWTIMYPRDLKVFIIKHIQSMYRAYPNILSGC